MDSRIPNNDVVENNVAYVDSIPIAAKYHAGISAQSLTVETNQKGKEEKRMERVGRGRGGERVREERK